MSFSCSSSYITLRGGGKAYINKSLLAEESVVLLVFLSAYLADALLFLGEALLVDLGKPGFDLLQLVRQLSQLELLGG